jgi:hypothetical protein
MNSRLSTISVLHFFNFVFYFLKLTLVGKGFLSLGDELRYYQSARLLRGIISFDYGQAIDAIFSANGRPFAVIFGVVPSIIQYASSVLQGVEMYSSFNSYAVFLYNFFIFSLILISIYKISELLFESKVTSLVTVLCYQGFVNSFLYLRHAQPYDLSLLVFLLVLYFVLLKRSRVQDTVFSKWKSFSLGAISFISFLTYPAFFQLFFITFFIFFFSSKKLKEALFYISGSTCVLLFIEFLSRLGKKSFITESLRLGTNANKQGSFDESHLFLFKYLLEVEGLLGVVTLISLLFVFLYYLYSVKKVSFKSDLFSVVFVSFFSVLVVYITSSYFLETILLSGRFLHQFFPFFSLVVGFSFYNLHKNKKSFFTVLFIFVTINSYQNISNTKKLNDVSYPEDIAWSLAREYNFKNFNSHCELGDNVISRFRKNIPLLRNIKKNDLIKKLMFVNTCLMYSEVRGELRLVPYVSDHTSEKLIIEEPHFFNFLPYTFEGAFPEIRELWRKRPFMIKVYEYF